MSTRSLRRRAGPDARATRSGRMVGVALVKSLYAIPTWSRTVRLVAEHDGLRTVLGCSPSVYACYRFAAKLRLYSDKLDACIGSVLGSLHARCLRCAATFPSTRPIFPPTRTDSATSPRAGASAPLTTCQACLRARQGASRSPRRLAPSAVARLLPDRVPPHARRIAHRFKRTDRFGRWATLACLLGNLLRRIACPLAL
jgi:hypothetical protein